MTTTTTSNPYRVTDPHIRVLVTRMAGLSEDLVDILHDIDHLLAIGEGNPTTLRKLLDRVHDAVDALDEGTLAARYQ